MGKLERPQLHLVNLKPEIAHLQAAAEEHTRDIAAIEVCDLEAVLLPFVFFDKVLQRRRSDGC